MPKLILNGKEYANNKPDGYPPIIYSDEEREIGVWRDGKPLYQKTIPVTFGTSNIAYEIESNIDKFMFVPEATFKIQNSSSNVTNYGFYVSATDRVQVYYRPSDHKLIVMSVGSDIAGDGFITYRYTKTTDIAGSGKWTTQGTPTHHYSTNEQVIGTWVDGKPLYQKTIHITGLGSSAGYKDFAIGVSNIKVVNFGGCYWFPNNGDVRLFSGILINSGGTVDNDYSLYAGIVSNAYVRIAYHYDRSNAEGYVTVQYTKTTD